MKQLVLILVIPIFINIPIFSQWENVVLVPDQNDLNDVFFINDDVGWVVGSDGFIMKTTNTGLKWTYLESGTNVILNDAHFIDENTGWAVGDSSTLLKSLDGGISWSKQLIGNGIETNLKSVHFVDQNKGWIVGNNGLIIRTTNGGNIWEILNSGGSEMLLDVNFINDQNGFAVGSDNNGGVLLSTTDGGNTWSSLTLSYRLYKIFFLNDNIGWISGMDSIYKTIDGGNEWNVIYSSGVSDEGTNFYDIYFIDENNGYTPVRLGGSNTNDGNHIIRTTDGGYTWFGGQDLTSYHLHGISGGIFMSTNGVGIAVGRWGQICMTEDFGNVWKILISGPHSNIFDIAIRNNNVRYAIGNIANPLWDYNGAILKPIQDSDYWIFEKTVGGNDVYNGKIIFVNDSVGYAVTNCDVIYKTIDGGNTWEFLYGPICEEASNDLFFLDESYGWTKNIYAFEITTDGGNTWVQVPGTVPRGKLYFLSPEIGFLGQYKTTNSGYDWYYTGGGAVKFFVNDSIGFSVGGNGGIWKTTDVGETWQEQNSGTLENLNDLYFVNDYLGYAVGGNGTIVATTNAGISWHHQESGTISNLRSIMFIDEVEGYIGGGILLKTTNGGGIIPVELTTFTAKSYLGKVTLIWSTATETNNFGFDIERLIVSDNNKWQKIGFRQGNGTTTETKRYTFSDDVSSIKAPTFKYRLKQIDYDGSYEYSEEVEVTNLAPTDYALQQNYPNPFNPVTTINYSLPVKSQVTLVVYNTLGESIVQLVSEEKEAGRYEVELSGNGLPSGIYFYRLHTNEFVKTKKMILLK